MSEQFMTDAEWASLSPESRHRINVEFQRLNSELDALRVDRDSWKGWADSHKKNSDELRAERVTLKEALEFYANDSNWFFVGSTDEWIWTNPKGLVFGGPKTARAALEAQKGGDK